MYFKKDYIKNEKMDFVEKIELFNENILISGDFWGIQKFIFEGLTTQYAAKVLRSKSAFILIYMDLLSQYIINKFDVDKNSRISLNAGKFEILLPKDKFDEKIFMDIQEKVDNYFLTNFYGLSGVSLAYVEVSKNEFENNYKKFREKILKEVEKIKFNKFDLNEKKAILKYDKDINNQNLCPICNIRKKVDEYCKICNIFVDLGKKLTYKEAFYISNKDLGIFEEYNFKVKVFKNLKSYVPKKENTPLTLEEIANNSCKNLETGIKALGVLKADVDGMGNFIKNSNVTENLVNFDRFSKEIDAFFSGYVTDVLRGKSKYKDKFKNIYTVFAGGDDLFLIGAWNEILDFARVIRNDFIDFQNNQGLTISFGIVISKPSIPIKYLAEISEEYLEKSKEVEEKDALTMFDESVKWESYLEVFEKLEKIFEDKEFDTVYLYRLLDICEMSKRVKFNNSIKDTMWKSKLVYISKDKNEEDILENIYSYIEKYPQEAKLFLVEYIYKRREK